MGLITGDASAVIGGPATLLLAPNTYPMPTKIADILSLSTYAPVSTYGFVAAGWTAAGLTMTREVSTKTTRADEVGLLQTYPIDYKSTVSATAKQASQANKVKLQQASIGAANSASELVSYFEAAAFLSIWRLAIVHQDIRGKFHARVYPHATWDGKAQKEMFARGADDEIDFSFECLPSTDATGPNGQPSDRIDFDMP